jgi:hypothetical protein
MTTWRPCKRREFIGKLWNLGFQGPYSGARHEFMIFERHRLGIPSNTEYSVPQLRMMLNEVESITERKISTEEWETLT